MGNRVNAYEIINSNYDGASQNLFIYTSNNFINYSDNDGFSAIEATGLLEVEKNGATHYSVKPKMLLYLHGLVWAVAQSGLLQ